MIEPSYKEAFSQEWVSAQIQDETNELVILCQVIPWQLILNRLIQFYDQQKGRIGKSLRIMVALLILSRLRQFSDRKIISQVKENRYMQYFCNVPDEKLATFLNDSTLCQFRKRLGEKGIAIIETSVFERLVQAGIIHVEQSTHSRPLSDALLMDSSVLANNLIYPTNVLLIYKAFLKMEAFARRHGLTPWWDHSHIKKRWRAFGLAKKTQRAAYLAEFYMLFLDAIATLKADSARSLPSELTSQLSISRKQRRTRREVC